VPGLARSLDWLKMKNPACEAATREREEDWSWNMDLLARFPRVWCPTCNKTQPMVFDAMKANDKNNQDAADIICDECKSIIATLHTKLGEIVPVGPYSSSNPPPSPASRP
jgi:hypothetical protein